MANRLQSWARIAAGVAVATGILVLTGWVTDREPLKRILPDLVAMNPLTALCFVLAGLSLCGVALPSGTPPSATARRLAARTGAAAVAIVGLLLFVRYALGWDCGLDQLLFREKLADEATGIPNRMAPNTALGFLLSGASILLLSEPRPAFIRAAQYLALLAALVAWMALLGYGYGASVLYGVASFIPMALPTAMAFLALALALLLARPDVGLMGTLSSPGIGGIVARRLLPAALVIPAILGGLRLWGEKCGLYDTEFGVALNTVAIIVLFVALIWWAAASLDRSEADRQRAEAEIRKLAAFPRVNPRPVMEFAADGALTYFNSATENLARALDQSAPADILPPNTREIVAACLATGESRLRLETRHGDRCVSWSFFPIPENRVVHCYAADITDIKRTQEERDRVFNLTPELLCIAGFDGRFRQLNPAWATTLGFTLEELKAQPFLEFVHPEDREATRAATTRIIAGHETIALENRYRCKDGSYKWLLWNSTPLPDQRLIFAAARDITARKATEESLRREITERQAAEARAAWSSRFLESVIENLPTMLFVKDAEHLRFVQINRAAEELCGVTRAQLLGKSDFDFYPEEEARFFVEKDRQALASGQTVDIPEEKIHTVKGEDRLLHTRKVPILDETGQPRYLLGVSEDITEMRQTQQNLERAHHELNLQAARLREANQELEAFSYSVSHDLRAPLRHINGFVDLLDRRAGPKLDDQDRRHLKVIADAARKMGQLIDDLLVFSRMGRVDIRKTTLQLEPLIRESISLHQADLAGRAVDWVVQPLPPVEADPGMMRQVVANLVANAIKYTRQRAQARIEIGCLNGQPEERVFYVRDNGAGFDMRYAHKLFGVFQRLHGESEFEGTGIGLANVRRIITRHGGRTWAEGQVGEGATFYFSLPKAPVQPADSSPNPNA